MAFQAQILITPIAEFVPTIRNPPFLFEGIAYMEIFEMGFTSDEKDRTEPSVQFDVPPLLLLE